MSERIVVNLSPVSAQECRDKQQQCALRLVEVCHYGFYDFIFVPRGNDDLRAGVQGFHIMPVEVGHNRLQGIDGRNGTPFRESVHRVAIALRAIPLLWRRDYLKE